MMSKKRKRVKSKSQPFAPDQTQKVITQGICRIYHSTENIPSEFRIAAFYERLPDEVVGGVMLSQYRYFQEGKRFDIDALNTFLVPLTLALLESRNLQDAIEDMKCPEFKWAFIATFNLCLLEAMRRLKVLDYVYELGDLKTEPGRARMEVYLPDDPIYKALSAQFFTVEACDG